MPIIAALSIIHASFIVRFSKSASSTINTGSQYGMTIHALVFEPSDVTLWGLDPKARLHRQLNEVGKTADEEFKSIHWIDHVGKLPTSGRILLFNGSFIFEHHFAWRSQPPRYGFQK